MKTWTNKHVAYVNELCIGKNRFHTKYIVCIVLLNESELNHTQCAHTHFHIYAIRCDTKKNMILTFSSDFPCRFRPMKFQENFLYGEEFEHCEIPHSSLKLSHNIGKGAFGSVYLAVADCIGSKECSGLVAVKKLKSKFFFCSIQIIIGLFWFEWSVLYLFSLFSISFFEIRFNRGS